MKNLQDADIGGVSESYFAMDESAVSACNGLREEARSWHAIRKELLDRKERDYDWRKGRMSMYVYHDDDDLLQVAQEAYCLYFTENALGRRAFPSVARMEAEVIGMARILFNAPDEAKGSFTSGGTESIFLALKAARDYFGATHAQKCRPEMVIPRTAHPAFDKAAQYLGLDVVRVNVDREFRVDTENVRAALSDRTMMIVGSAPCYPYGVFDSIQQLAEIALSRGVWLHVDACLGGFLAPFAQEEGYAIPHFDFGIPGVSSLSADLHKFGFCAKGASIVIYRDAALHRYQGFRFENWPRGTYTTETFAGSRPAGAVASAWAVSQYLGKKGYRKLARKTMEAKRRLMSGIERISGLEVLRPSELNILLYRSIDEGVDINAVAELMGRKGWFVGRSREPAAVHMALNPVHDPIVDDYLLDLHSVVKYVRQSGRVAEHDDTTY